MYEIDIHTHQQKSEALIQIINTFAQDLPFAPVVGFYSTGIHPWHIEQVDPEKCLQSIDVAAVQKNMIAIGECGLDRSISADFAVQERYFKMQIEIAERHCKPLIIHCVRAFPELIKIKKETKSTVPWIIHGFQGNRYEVLQLIGHNFYFSVGEKLLTNDQKKEILTIIPADRLFLETDDSETSINKIYSMASQILNIDEETLCRIILGNFKNVFGIENAVNNNIT